MNIHIEPKAIEIPEQDPFKHDLLGRRKAVETLTNLVTNVEGPCVIAGDAPWGAGKTTFLKMWTQHLRNQGVPVVEFNAWETDYSEDPFLTLSSELTEHIEAQSEKWKIGQKKLEELKSEAVEIIGKGLSGLIRWGAGQVPYIGREIGDAMDSFAKRKISEYGEARKSLRQFRKALERMATEIAEANEGRTLVITIDELDRCRPSYAVQLLEVMKHLFSVNGIVFVLAINRDQLAHSVKALYGNDFDGDGYLRRFFNATLRLPEPDRHAFIQAQLQATGIDRYFDQIPKWAKSSASASVYFPGEAKRKERWKDVQAMLELFFGDTEVDLRTANQAIHHLGVLYACLRKDEDDYGLATTVALILRTMDRGLYDRFVKEKASDLEVVDKLFERPGLKTRRYEDGVIAFEATLILCTAARQISAPSQQKQIHSPLLDRYRELDRTEQELLQDGNSEDATRIDEAEHGKRVVNAVEKAMIWEKGRLGFPQAVHRLELFSEDLNESERESSDMTS